MSPISQPHPCPFLEFDGAIKGPIASCKIYDKRPKECVNHEYPSRFCPVGIDILKLDYEDTVQRIQHMQPIEDSYTIKYGTIK